MSSNTLPSRAAQTPLHKMYTFVYRTFIKFILFCRGQALDVQWYRDKRIKLSLGGLSPMEYRRSLGIA